MIVHVPHSSTNTDYLKVSQHCVDMITDHYTDDIFYYPTEHFIVSEYNRMVVDLERLENDPLAAIGNGVLYMKDCNGLTIYRNENKDKQLYQYYLDHHVKLNTIVHNQLHYLNKCILVDCHSFSQEQAGVDYAPDFCIGYNDDLTHDPVLVDMIVNFIASSGFSVDVNFPYSNSMSIREPIEGFKSVMIEVNKNLYMDQITLEKTNNYNNIKSLIGKLLAIIDDYET